MFSKVLCVNLSVAIIALVAMPETAQASIIAAESFDYNNNQKLKDRNGGSGDWKTGNMGKWSGDNKLKIVAPGTLSYTDFSGNTLNTSGGHVRNTHNSTKKGERRLNNTKGSNGTSVWLGVLIEGATGGSSSGRQTNVALANKFFVGQGSNSNSSTTWTLYDQDGQSFNSGVTAGGNTAFLAVQIDFSSGNDDAWLWINPDLDSTPNKSDAANGLSGSSIKDFEFDKIELYFNRSSDGFIDELRVATSFGEISPFTAALNDTILTTSAALDFGSMLLGYDPSSQNADVSKTGARATTYTSTASNNGITVTADGNIAAGAQTKTINVDFNTNTNGSGTSGAKNFSVTIDNTATTSAAAGQGSANANSAIAVTGQVFQAGDPTANNGASLGDGESATISNAASSDGGQRASVFLDSFSTTGDGWSVSDLIAGTTATGVATGTDTSFSGTVNFDAAGKLNGTHDGSLSTRIENDQSLAGAADLDLNSGNPLVWQLSQTLTGNTGDQGSTVASGTDLGDLAIKFHGISNVGSGTTAALLDGTLSSDRTITIGSWRVGVPGEGGADYFLSDVFNLSGTESDTYVLQVGYDDSSLGANETTLAAAGNIFLAWLDAGLWVNAVDGNFGGTPNMILAGYNPTTDFALGNWGVDTTANNVWAVLNHNSEFGVAGAGATPEPSTFAFAALGLLSLGMTRRRRRR